MLKKSQLKKRRSPLKVKSLEDDIKKLKRTAFYQQCVDKVGLKSHVSGKRILGDRINYHHVLPKRNYPEVQFCFLGILAVTLDEHVLIEGDRDKFQENLDKIKFLEDNWEYCVNLSKEWELDFENKRGGY